MYVSGFMSKKIKYVGLVRIYFKTLFFNPVGSNDRNCWLLYMYMYITYT